MQSQSPPRIESLARDMREARHVVVLTGAGISTESGLPDFRSGSGLWKNVDPARVASLTALRQTPVEFYEFYRMRLSRLAGAAPNAGHRAMARLQAAGHIQTLITQNVDGLHQAAGATDVIEVHGSLRTAHCLDCERDYPTGVLDRDVTTTADIPRCACGGMIRPGVVLFEELLPAHAMERAFAAARQADLFLVVGSSLQVGPVNMLPRVAIGSGARLAIVNLDPTPEDGWATWVLAAPAGAVLLELARQVGCGDGE